MLSRWTSRPKAKGSCSLLRPLGSKTSITVEAKTRLLPYVCVASGVSDTPWAQLWMQAREKEGITFDRGCLPSWSHKWGCWGQERMSSEEAADYLYENTHFAWVGAGAWGIDWYSQFQGDSYYLEWLVPNTFFSLPSNAS